MTAALHPALDRIRSAEFVTYHGSVIALGQNSVEAAGPLCSVGEICRIDSGGGHAVMAQVVAVKSDRIKLLPFSPLGGVRLGAKVSRLRDRSTIWAGDGFAGRAVDGFGQPIDGGGPVINMANVSGEQARPAKLDRTIVAKRVPTGLRAVDGLIPIAQGQRIGIFAASGVGKTTLIEQMSGAVEADHCVMCLIGERGREVERFWRIRSADDTRARFTLVAATSDESAIARVRALDQALAISEYWRAQGKHVVLFVDSVTRLAMALREIGLAAGEPPSLRSYTPNVFAALPHYVERCGADRKSGAITAIFTVLAETDDLDDPIVETLKSLLDGHIVLSRGLADKGHFPPIDVGASVSRVADQVLSPEAHRAALAVKRSFAEFEEARTMIESGIYRAGSNPAIDRAITQRAGIIDYLQQDVTERCSLAETDAAMAVVAGAAA